jgi:hypothetical protein
MRRPQLAGLRASVLSGLLAACVLAPTLHVHAAPSPFDVASVAAAHHATDLHDRSAGEACRLCRSGRDLRSFAPAATGFAAAPSFASAAMAPPDTSGIPDTLRRRPDAPRAPPSLSAR